MTSTPVRRRGPRPDVDAKSLIVDTAERLFGDATIDAVSMRAIARDSGLGSRSVTYYFATKQDLIRAIMRRRSPQLAAATVAGLAALETVADPLPVRRVVAAILDPFVAIFAADSEGGLRWMKIFSQLALTEDQLWSDELGTDPSITDLFIAALGRAMPDVEEADRHRRAGIAMYSLVMMLASADRAGYGHPLGPDGLDPQWVEQLIVFTSAGLRGEAEPRTV